LDLQSLSTLDPHLLRWLIVPIAVVVIFNLPWIKAIRGRMRLWLTGRLRLPSRHYRRFNKRRLRLKDGDIAQIDQILVSRFGIFVVSVASVAGKIVGDAKDQQWLQQRWWRSRHFPNPLLRNYLQARTIETLLGLGPGKVRSVIVFVGNGQFESLMPPNLVHQREFVDYIRSYQSPCLSEDDCQHVSAQIKAGRLAEGMTRYEDHIAAQRDGDGRNTRSRRRAPTLDPVIVCPKCGAAMQRRLAERGPKAGQAFWVCTNAPKCRTLLPDLRA